MSAKLSNIVDRLLSSRHTNARIFDYACVICGVLSNVFALIGITSSSFLPPISPSWRAEKVVKHYQEHETGIQAGAAFIILAGLFYFPPTAVISAQMRRIPNMAEAAITLQTIAGAAVGIFFIVGGIALALAVFRVDRSAEITILLNDMVWLNFIMGFPAYGVQGIAVAWGAITDKRPKPCFPKFLAITPIIALPFFLLVLLTHGFKTGPFAWNGGLSFWTPTVLYFGQVTIEYVALWRAISSQPYEEPTTASNAHDGSPECSSISQIDT
jgi:hypothetical protein